MWWNTWVKKLIRCCGIEGEYVKGRRCQSRLSLYGVHPMQSKGWQLKCRELQGMAGAAGRAGGRRSGVRRWPQPAAMALGLTCSYDKSLGNLGKCQPAPAVFISKAAGFQEQLPKGCWDRFFSWHSCCMIGLHFWGFLDGQNMMDPIYVSFLLLL